MKISPPDVRKQTFRKVMRGFDPPEVTSFLELLADQLEELVQEKRQLQDRIATMDVQLENYRKIEEALRNALVTAETVARDTKKSADQEVGILMKEAELRAQRAVQSARGILESLRNDLVELSKQRRDFLARFRMLVETQLKMLDLKKVEYEGDEDLRRLDEIQRALFEETEEDEEVREEGRMGRRRDEPAAAAEPSPQAQPEPEEATSEETPYTRALPEEE